MSDKTIVGHILAGQYVFPEGFFKLGEEVLDLPGVRRQIYASRSEFEKLKILESVFPKKKFQQLLDMASNVLRKKDTLTELLKETGDKFLKQSNMTSALRSYNLATSFIPAKNQHIGSLFGLRATVLYKSEKIVECLSDIETASAFKLTPKLEASLVELKLKCIKLKSEADSQEHKQNQDIRDYCDNVMFNISGNPNSKIKSGTEFIEIQFSKEKGRHIVVTKDLEPGVTVMVENPYVTVLNEVVKWDMKNCSHCLKKIVAGVRCRKCVFNTYCSDACRRADFYNGHQYECKLMPFLHIMRVPSGIHMCLKIVCKAGPKALYGIYQNNKNKNTNMKIDEIKGFDPATGMYNSDSYHQIRNLISHDTFDGLPIITIPWISLSFVQALDYKTLFFKDIKSSDKSEFMTFLANELMFHCHAVPFNPLGLYESLEIPAGGDGGKMMHKRQDIGSGLYPLISLLNHGCDPTVSRSTFPNGKMAIITNRKMKAGDELLVTYGCTFTKDELSYRQSKIKNGYRFSCDCFACRYDWPNQKKLKKSLEFMCPNCCGSFEYRNTDEAKKRLLIPSDNGGMCKTCGKEYELGKLRMDAFSVQDKLVKAQNLVQTGKMIEAIPLLIECIEYYQTKMLYPNSSLFTAQELLRKSHALIVAASAL